ncbi:hypothetical protein BJV82DRAFT_583847 [Fennellomyces sp. T-0311]|nr:hypothetical protein BJV82DRAFT_583847 [Fennellomyces sp. T-0311]
MTTHMFHLQVLLITLSDLQQRTRLICSNEYPLLGRFRPLLQKLSKKLKFRRTSAHSSIQPDSSGSDHMYLFPNAMTNQTEDHPLQRLSQTPGRAASTLALGRPAGPVTRATAAAAHAAGSSADADLAELAEFDEDLDVPTGRKRNNPLVRSMRLC